jgi:hypothetical protein
MTLILYRLAFGKIWYDIYNVKREHVVSLMLRKTFLRSKIQHRIHVCEILDNDKMTNIGCIYPYSTYLERTKYGYAVAMKSLLLLYRDFFVLISFSLVPKDLKVEIKAKLLIAGLILVCTFKF